MTQSCVLVHTWLRLSKPAFTSAPPHLGTQFLIPVLADDPLLYSLNTKRPATSGTGGDGEEVEEEVEEEAEEAEEAADAAASLQETVAQMREVPAHTYCTTDNWRR